METRLDQLIEWCGEDFDGLIMLNECHKAKTVKLDENANPVMSKDKNAGCTQTARAVLHLQRVVYCSATSVLEPKNLGFMSR